MTSGLQLNDDWRMMDIADYIDFAILYKDLGWAVQEQLSDVIDGRDLEELNPNALREIDEFLSKIDQRYDIDGISAWRDDIGAHLTARAS